MHTNADLLRKTAATLRVIPVRPQGLDEARWRCLIDRSPQATVFHDPGWLRAVASVFRYAEHHLGVEDATGRLAGVLPLFHVRTLKGSLLVSVPHATYGGVLAEAPEAVPLLLDEARAVAERLGARAVDLRQRHPIDCDLPACEDYATFVRALPDRPEDLRRYLPKKSREACRQAERKGLTVDLDGDLDTFYPLFESLYRRLGSPVYPQAFLEAIRRELPDRTNVLIVRQGDRPVAGVLSLIFRDTLMPYYAGEADDASPLRANNLKYWKLMEWGVARGLQTFDFGRTRWTNRGPFDFKRHQGFEPQTLPYRFIPLLGEGRSVPTPATRTFRIASTLWRRLPRAAARALGTRIVGYFP